MFNVFFVKLLQKNNTTAYKLSKETGIKEGLISQWKSGRQLPKFDNIVTLCNYFNISADYFLGRTDNPVNPNLYINNVEFEAAHKKAEDFEIEQKNKDIEF